MDHDAPFPIARTGTALEARRRALRTARAVTLSVAAAASLAGCGSATILATEDASMQDTGEDTGPQGPSVLPDSTPVTATPALTVRDAAAAGDVPADGGPNCTALRGVTDGGVDAWLACCEQNGWDWRRGCEAWGPFMPPEMEG